MVVIKNLRVTKSVDDKCRFIFDDVFDDVFCFDDNVFLWRCVEGWREFVV